MRCYFLYSDSFYAFSSPCHCYEVLGSVHLFGVMLYGLSSLHSC